MLIAYVFVFGFGAIIGSFLNVVIDRHNTGRGLGGRSTCDTTGKILAWYELVPIISFLIQRGKSRHSKTRLSLQYPLVEIGTALLFVLLFQKAWPWIFHYPLYFTVSVFSMWALFSVLVVIFVYDLKHMIIPNKFVWIWNSLALLFSIVFVGLGYNLLAGPAVALPLLLLWLLSRGRWIGFGDVKFALGMGWVLGLSGGVAALLLSFWIGAIVGVVILLVRKKGKDHAIPFAPFLVIGTFLAFLYTVDMQMISHFFSRLVL